MASLIDDLALRRMEATETGDFYELIVERHRAASTIVTSNRESPEILEMMADPSLAQIGCRPASVRRVRARHRRPVLPATAETYPAQGRGVLTTGLRRGTIV